jgi:hypothetical protein
MQCAFELVLPCHDGFSTQVHAPLSRGLQHPSTCSPVTRASAPKYMLPCHGASAPKYMLPCHEGFSTRVHAPPSRGLQHPSTCTLKTRGRCLHLQTYEHRHVHIQKHTDNLQNGKVDPNLFSGVIFALRSNNESDVNGSASGSARGKNGTLGLLLSKESAGAYFAPRCLFIYTHVHTFMDACTHNMHRNILMLTRSRAKIIMHAYAQP